MQTINTATATVIGLGLLLSGNTHAQQAESAPFKNQIERMMTVPHAIDSDGNGSLSTEEVAAAPQQLLKLDKNSNGSLEPEEIGAYLKILPLVRSHLITNVIDADGDVHISAEEIENAANILKILDTDGDWSISEAELNAHRNVKRPVFNLRNRSVALWEDFRGYEAELAGPILPGQDARSFNGYIYVHDAGDDGLVQMSNHDYLLDNAGEIVHEWKHNGYSPEASVGYLLPNGQLLRTYSKHHWTKDHEFPVGAFSTIELVDWDGNVLWDFSMSKPDKYSFHHDVKYMPDGNILTIRYTAFTVEEAAALGWNPAKGTKAVHAIHKEGSGTVWMDAILELKPDLEDGSTEIVWQWNTWEHLVQDTFADKRNFGDVTDASMINANYINLDTDIPFNKGQMFHVNSVDYNHNLDMVAISSPVFGEIWFVDHSTTMAEAATGQGGKYGKGGNLLHRFGNDEAFGKADRDGSTLFWQHDAHWIEEGLPGAGNILIFNNGTRRTLDDKYIKVGKGHTFGKSYSNLLEVKLPLTDDAVFVEDASSEVVWSWEDPDRASYYSPFMSGAQRLPNGNTIFERAYDKYIIEVTPEGEKVLDFSLAGWGRLHRIYKYGPDYSGLKFPH